MLNDIKKKIKRKKYLLKSVMSNYALSLSRQIVQSIIFQKIKL